MIDWIAILSLVAIGLVLIIVEVIFIPGTTVIGILGAIFVVVGIVISYQTYGSGIGTIVLIVSLVTSAIALIISFKSGVWQKFALNSSINSRVNEEIKHNLWIGDEGKAISSLKPIGKAEFNDLVFEVRTIGDYVDAGTKVRIIKIDDQRIFVEPINK